MKCRQILAPPILIAWFGLVLLAQNVEATPTQPTLPDGTYGAKAGVGVACVPFGSRTAEPPVNYAVAEIGRKGMPRLELHELAMVRRIQHYIKSRYLRFTWVQPHDFIVYDAIAGLCIDTAPGYPILNRSCGEYYEPGEVPWLSSKVPDCTAESKSRPWIKR
jgi:hypothetical protein